MISDAERRAAAALPPQVYDYYRATGGGPDVLDRQIAAWEAFRFRPRSLAAGGTAPSTATTVLGTAVDTPVLVAPMAQQVAAHPRGEIATAEGVARAGSLLGVSTNTGCRFADIAAAGAPWWFQCYVMEDRGLTEAMLARAVDAGARAVLLTVDITGLEHPTPDADYPVEPRDWGERSHAAIVANVEGDERARFAGGGSALARDLGFDAIGWVAERSGLPVIVKGVLRGDDAARCVDEGASAVCVSTHGARGLAQSIGSADAIVEVVDAVDGRVEVYADSGLRRGAHVAAALSAGARAVFVGRPAMWGLATGGADGVAGVVTGLTAELRRAMDLLGAPTVDRLTRDLLA